MSVTIYGASDDLVEVEGDVCEEFSHNTEPGYIALSNGCLFSVAYLGVWRITPVFIPEGVTYTKVEAVGEDDDAYSDRVTIDDPIKWVVYGDEMVRRRSAA